jgi:hypothetical protein
VVIEREELAQVVGRYGSVPQDVNYPHGPHFYGKIVDVTGDYVKFDRRHPYKPRWYHRRDVTLHPLRPASAA